MLSEEAAGTLESNTRRERHSGTLRAANAMAMCGRRGASETGSSTCAKAGEIGRRIKWFLRYPVIVLSDAAKMKMRRKRITVGSIIGALRWFRGIARGEERGRSTSSRRRVGRAIAW